MKILGISGSPIRDSNTDRAVMTILDATGLEYEFVKLVDLKIEPCKACLGCLNTNRCVINDDGIMLAEKAKNCQALVVGGYTPYSSLDARTKAFLERLYPLRHKYGFMRGKYGISVITCAIPSENKNLPPACENGTNAIMYYMMEEGMNHLGSLVITGNVPCVKCGFGNDCETSGLKMIFGDNATVETIGINLFNEEQQKLAVELGTKLRKLLLK